MITSTSARPSSAVVSAFNDPGNGTSPGKLPISAVAQSPEEMKTHHLNFTLTDEQARKAITKEGLRDILRAQGHPQEDVPKETKEQRTKRSATAPVDHCEQDDDYDTPEFTRQTLRQGIRDLQFKKAACKHVEGEEDGPLFNLSSQLVCFIDRMRESPSVVKQNDITKLMEKIASAPRECLPAFPDNLRDLQDYFSKEFAHGLTTLSTLQKEKINKLLKTEDPFAPESSELNEDGTIDRRFPNDLKAPQRTKYNFDSASSKETDAEEKYDEWHEKEENTWASNMINYIQNFWTGTTAPDNKD